jgi:hypothetical protein
MKLKIIVLLGILLTCGISASPNRSCNGKPATITPVKKVMMMIDEAELMPMHYFLRNF